jgi:hypothetical protein
MLAVIDRDMAMWTSIASGRHSGISFLGRIAVWGNDNGTILQQGWTPVFRIDWMTTCIHSTGFKGPSAIGGTLA